MESAHGRPNKTPVLTFRDSIRDRTSNRRKEQHQRHKSEQFAPYPPLPKPVTFAEAYDDDDDQDFPMPNLDIMDTQFTARKSSSPSFTPEAPKKNGRFGTAASKRSFSSPVPSTIMQADETNIISECVESCSEHINELSDKKFVNGELIGTGSQGNVYKAFHTAEQKWYAIKVLKRVNLKGTQKQRLQTEITNVSKLAPHPHLLPYLCAWECDGEIFLQMDLCKESLEDYLNRWQSNQGGYIKEATLWEYLTDITMGLHQIHSHGFVHRDIKPGNIFFDYAGFLRLGDFGLLVQESLRDSRDGDCRYMAKEVLNDDVNTFKSDIFSVGATMFELTCLLEMPQNGKIWDILRDGGGPLESLIPPCYSDDFKQFLLRLMDPNPDFRPSTEAILDLQQTKNSLLTRNRKVTREPQTVPHPITNRSHRSRSISSPNNSKLRPNRALFDMATY